jgi:signal transduction histidine kinase
MQIYQSIHPDDLPKLLSDREQFSNPGAIMKFTFRFRRKDGEWIWIEGVSQNLITDPAIGGIVTNYRDITEQVRYEEALRRSNDYLKKSNDELDRFVYSVSHDLRAPLASILGAIEYSEAETDDEEILENLGLMKTSAQKLDGFILDILDYSRNARTEVKSEEINFEELFNDVSAHLKFMGTGNRNVDVRLIIESKKPFYSDRSRLGVVVNNLVSNSIRYCNPDEEQPFVSLHLALDDNGAILTIADNGVGIDPKHHEKIFDMFYRASKKSAGSGLGLYIVKEAIEKLQGTLQFESEPGKGTKFTIFLPDLNK